MATAKQKAWRAKFARMYGGGKKASRKGGKKVMAKKKSGGGGFRGFGLGSLNGHLDRAAKGMGYVDLAIMAGGLLAPEQTAQMNTPVVRVVVAGFKGGMEGAGAEALRSGLIGGVVGGVSTAGSGY